MKLTANQYSGFGLAASALLWTAAAVGGFALLKWPAALTAVEWGVNLPILTLAFVLIARETAHRYRLQLALRDSELRYRTVVESLHEGVVVHSADGMIRAFNQRAVGILGMTTKSLQGRTPFDPGFRTIRDDGSPFPADEHPASVSLRNSLPLSGVVMGICRPDGATTWVSINSQPIAPLDPGGPHSVVVSYADITARRQAEEELRRQTGLMTAVLNQMGDGVVVADTSGRLLVFNPAAEKIVGIGSVDVAADAWAKAYGLFLSDTTTLCPPDRVPLARAIRGETADDVELFVRHLGRPEGVWISVNARPLVDEHGLLSGGVVTFHDRTELKRAEMYLAKSRPSWRIASGNARPSSKR